MIFGILENRLRTLQLGLKSFLSIFVHQFSFVFRFRGSFSFVLIWDSENVLWMPLSKLWTIEPCLTLDALLDLYAIFISKFHEFYLVSGYVLNLGIFIMLMLYVARVPYCSLLDIQ